MVQYTLNVYYYDFVSVYTVDSVNSVSGGSIESCVISIKAV